MSARKTRGTRGMGAVYRRPQTRHWWIRYTVGGREIRESSDKTLHSEAVDVLKQRLKEAGERTWLPPADRKATVAELLDALVTDYTVRRLASLRTVRAHCDALCDRRPDGTPGRTGIGTIPASRLTTDRIKRLVTVWQVQHAAPATINKRLGTLRAAFFLAAASDPPLVTRVPPMPHLDELNAREGFFEKAEFQALLPHLPDDGLRDFVAWAFWTGMRKGEIAKLEWAAYDRETATLTLPARSAKTKKPRTLVLTGPLKAIMDRRSAARRLDCRLLFHRDGARVYEFRKAWASACRQAGLTGKLFHDLRRTGVRNLIRAGVDRKVAMKISGHRTESVFERYNIDTDDDLRAAVEQVSAYVDTLPESPTVVALPTRR
jgi:integrase